MSIKSLFGVSQKEKPTLYPFIVEYSYGTFGGKTSSLYYVEREEDAVNSCIKGMRVEDASSARVFTVYRPVPCAVYDVTLDSLLVKRDVDLSDVTL